MTYDYGKKKKSSNDVAGIAKKGQPLYCTTALFTELYCKIKIVFFIFFLYLKH